MIIVDLKFPSYDELIKIKTGDFRLLKYESKKKQEESVHENGKRDYYERRGARCGAQRPRQIRDLESKLHEHTIILCEWSSDSLITFVFSSGVIAYVTVNCDTLDISRVLFDRYCVGKLSGQNVSAVVFSDSHIVFVYAERLATLISYGSNLSNNNTPCRIANRDPHIQTVQLAGAARRSERFVSWAKNASGLLVLVWSSICSDPVPWSPVAEDRANVHLYHINDSNMKLMNYLQLENEILSAQMSKTQKNIIHVIEQINIQKTGVYCEWSTYEALNSLETISKLCTVGEIMQSELPAPAHVVRLSVTEIQLLVACIDGSLHIMHHSAGLTHSVHAGFIATEVRWAGDMVVACEDRGRLQCYDRALAPLHHHEKCLDLAQHLRESRSMSLIASRVAHPRTVLLMSFSGGPLALMRITHPKLPAWYMRAGREGRAVAFLRSLDWAAEGERCLSALQEVVRGAMRAGLRASTEPVVQAALGAYFQNKANTGAAAHRFAPSVHDLGRKFFHHLLRRGRLDKALSLAVELGAADLFADARWAAARAGLRALADEAHDLAAAAAPLAARPSAHDSTCSESCSQCSSSSSRSGSDDEISNSNRFEVRRTPPPLPRVPPLPARATVLPVPILPHEPISTDSIRPLHQYLNRDLSIWNKDVTDASSKVILKQSFQPNNTRIQHKPWLDIDSSLLDYEYDPRRFKPLNVSGHKTRVKVEAHASSNPPLRSYNERLMNFERVHRTEPRGPASSSAYDTVYRYRDEPTTSYDRKTYSESLFNDSKPASRYPGEKNKVKFSDTVTIAVVPEDRSVQERSSHPGSLPRVHLAGWPPAPAPAAPPAPPAPPGTMHDYVEV